MRTVSDIAELVGWRDGLIFFDKSTLAQAAAEMNRYLDHPKIEVAPDVYFINWLEAAGTTVSQVLDFNMRNVAAFVTFEAAGRRQGMLDTGTFEEEGRATFQERNG